MQAMDRAGSSVFVFFLLLPIVSLVVFQGHESGPSKVCWRNGLPLHVCVKWNNCSTGKEIIQNRAAVFCGLEDAVPRLCCPQKFVKYLTSAGLENVTTSTAENATKSTTTVTTTPIIRKNATAVAEAMCREYGQYRFTNTTLPGPLIGDPDIIHSKTDCINVIELIVGGTLAKPKEFPHMALIGYGNSSTSIHWACGGSLISDRFILSAAHCANTEYGGARWALLGDLNITTEQDQAAPKIYEIERRINHPEYRDRIAYNDITLFQLNSSVKFSPFIRPICLYTSTTVPDEEKKASVVGWGLTGTIERRSDHLLKVSISFIEDKVCHASYDTDEHFPRGYDPNSMICAGDTVQEKGTCLGDSGGPLQLPVRDSFCMWHLVGITSIGSGICGNIETPTIYTKVANYVDWIQQIVWP